MKAQFIVTIEGDWLENDRRVTAVIAGRSLRSAVKEEFDCLADRITVKRITGADRAAMSAGDAKGASDE